MFVNLWNVLANLQQNLFGPIWNNHNIQSGEKPFVFNPWSDQGVFVLVKFSNYCNQGLMSFQGLKECYNLPGYSSFFI